MIFALPALALTTSFGLGLFEAVILVATVIYSRALWRGRRELFFQARWIMLAFAVNLALAVISTLTFHSQAFFLDNPSRQLLVVGAIGLVPLLKPKAHWFWYGLFFGAIGAAGLAVFQRFWLNWDRAGGFHQIIMFGDISMAMGLMSLASIDYFRHKRLFAMPYVAFFAGVVASVLSGSRGGWIAVFLAVIPLWAYRKIGQSHKLAYFVGATLALFIGACWVPALGIMHRLALISSEIQLFKTGTTDTSIGLRLEMWRAACKLVAEHPLMGVGRANFNQGLNELIARGEIDASVHDFYHAHDEMLHALATQGLFGGLVLATMYIAPMVFFMRNLRRDGVVQPFAVAGLLVVLSFICFGATQVMFAHHVGSAFYALMVCILAGVCIAHRSPSPSS